MSHPTVKTHSVFGNKQKTILIALLTTGFLLCAFAAVAGSILPAPKKETPPTPPTPPTPTPVPIVEKIVEVILPAKG